MSSPGMRRITGLHERPRGRVVVEIDGAEWRIFPVEVVARSGLRAGAELDRSLLRSLARELRRAKALTVAARALRRRDLSTRRMDERLSRSGVAPAARAEAMAVLSRSGLLDDERFAAAQARSLAERNLGDAAIRYDLEAHGIDPDGIERAFAEVPSERERADRVVARRGRSPATARYLARRGFGTEAVESAAGVEVAHEP